MKQPYRHNQGITHTSPAPVHKSGGAKFGPWKAATYLILTFGMGGTIYKRTQDSLDIVGVGPAEVKKLLKDIHLRSVAYLHNIVIQQCHLDSEALRPQTP